MDLAELQLVRPIAADSRPLRVVLARLGRLARVYATLALGGAALTLLVMAADWRLLTPVLLICTIACIIFYRAFGIGSMLEALTEWGSQWMSLRVLARADRPASPRVALDLSNEEWAELMVGSIFGSRYRIESVLRREGVSTVYKAKHLVEIEDTDHDAPRALTLVPVRSAAFPATAIERAHDEVRRLRSLAHANVVRRFDAGTDEGMHFILTELVRGYTLADLLAEVPDRRMSVRTVIGIVRQICRGLGALHTHGVIHGEFAPADVLIDATGTVKLLGYGLDRIKHLAEETTTVERVAAMGTPQDDMRFFEYDTQTDITSLGILIAELLIGPQPWFSTHPAQLPDVRHIVTSPIVVRPDIGRALNTIIMRCFEEDPARRFDSPTELLAALDAVDADEGSAALRA